MKVLGGIVGIGLLTAATAFGQARLVAPLDKFDFGILPPNSVLVHHFWLRSAGADTVTITDVKTGCSCAASELEKNVLAPGDSVLLGIRWDIGRSHGSIFRSPLVFFNNSEQTLRLSLEGQVWDDPETARPVTVKPFRFELSRAAIKDIDGLPFTLTNHSGEELSIELLSLAPEEIELVLPEKIPANGSASGSVRVKPEFRNTEFSTSITLLVRDERNTHVTIPVRRKFY